MSAPVSSGAPARSARRSLSFESGVRPPATITASPIAEEKGLTVQCSTPVGDYRTGNRLTLQRVLLNLVSNALKFTHQGGVHIEAAEAAPGRVRFSVQDSGPGIAPAALAALYRPFRRAPTGQGYRFSSTGLGLAVSRRLVAAMGAELRHDSTADEGTRFWFELDLPRTDPDYPGGGARAATGPPVSHLTCGVVRPTRHPPCPVDPHPAT